MTAFKAVTSLLITPAVLLAYYAILTAFLAASFFPQYRVWGMNLWAYFPIYVPLVLFGLGAVIPFAIRWIPGRDQDNQSNGKYWLITIGLTVLFGLAFYFLRARTHFLGDGYTVLSLLAQENPLVKTRELGEALAHIWMKSAVGGGGVSAALLSFQVISISSGILFLVTVGAVGKSLFERTTDRLLFWLGLCSGGYMLLFFGYVENYSLLVLAVAIYSLMGLLVIKGKVNRWLTLIPLASAIFFHVIAATLIPSAVYLLAVESRAGTFIARQGRAAKIALTLAMLAVVIWVFHHFYTTDYFFRFAFVPLLENRFTVEGYTLFSIRHLADYLNLLLLLLPGLPIVVAALWSTPLRNILKRRECRFLLILAASTLGAIFVLDPKLGMPRDWDLFSFVGVPLAIVSYYLVLGNRRSTDSYVSVCVLSITLCLLGLCPRVVAQVNSSISVSHFKDYLMMDRVKNRNGRGILKRFYRAQGQEQEARKVRVKRRQDFPEEGTYIEANRLMKAGSTRRAAALFTRVVDLNPIYWNAWSALGNCYKNLKEYDSALVCLEIADGLNPYNDSICNRLAWTCFHKGDYGRARRLWLNMLEQDSLLIDPKRGLARLYQVTGDEERYYQYIVRAASRNDAPLDIVKSLGDYYLSLGAYEEAARTYEKALEKGLDSAYVDSLLSCHPQLQQYLPLAPTSGYPQ